MEAKSRRPLFLIVFVLSLSIALFVGWREIASTSASEAKVVEIERDQGSEIVGWPVAEGGAKLVAVPQIRRDGEAGSMDRVTDPQVAFDLRVVDAITGLGVTGANLQLDQRSRTINIQCAGDGTATVLCASDPAGEPGNPALERSMLDCSELNVVTGRVDAPGYSTQVFDLAASSRPNRQVVIAMERSATFQLLALDVGGAPVVGAKLVIDRPPTYDALPSEGGVINFDGRRMSFSSDPLTGRSMAVGILGTLRRDGLTDEGGLVTIEDVPVRSPLLLRLSESGRVHDLGQVVLTPGQVEYREWRRPVGSRIDGKLLFAPGTAIPEAGIPICISRADGSEETRHLMRGDEVVFATTMTAEGGHFFFDEVPAGSWLVAPRFVLNAPMQHRTQKNHGCLAWKLELPAEKPELVQLVVLPPLYLLGSVRTASGGVQRQSRIVASSHEYSGSVFTHSDADGYYSLGPLIPGRYKVEVKVPGGGSSVVDWEVTWPSPSVLDLLVPDE